MFWNRERKLKIFELEKKKKYVFKMGDQSIKEMSKLAKRINKHLEDKNSVILVTDMDLEIEKVK